MPSSTQHPPSRDFFELYRSYKRKTQTAVSWLKQVCKLENTTIASLIAAAEKVIKQRIPIPAGLYYTFKDALDLRLSVAQQYKHHLSGKGSDASAREAIEKHDFFVEKYVTYKSP